MNNHAPTIAVVLAGGLGRRMGGVDKGLLPFGGSTLVEHVLARVAPQVDEIILSTPNAEYGRFGHRLIADAIPGRAGPLAGILTALEQAEGLVLSVPCDVPQLPTDLVARLAACLNAGKDVCSAHDGARAHPVIALWHPRVASSLRAYLERGERRVQSFIESLQHGYADFSDEAALFANVNTPEELHRMEQKP